MTEIEIIKKLFVALSSKSIVTVILTDGEKASGQINAFDGNSVSIGNNVILLSSISSIEEPPQIADEANTVKENTDVENTDGMNIDYSRFKARNVLVRFKGDNNTEEEAGFLFDIKNNSLVLVTKANKRVIRTECVLEICESVEPPKEQRNIEQNSSVPDEFENALIDGKKDMVEQFFSSPSKLADAGYSEEEIASIGRLSRNPVPWNDNSETMLYNQARRLFTYIQNRDRLAEQFFKEYLSSERVSNKLKVKAISTLIEIYGEEGPEKVVDIYHQYEDVIKNNASLAYWAAKALLQAKEYKLVRDLVDNSTPDADLSNIEFSLEFIEKHSSYDFSTLPGLDSLDPKVSLKELRLLLELPNKSAFQQLLGLYSKHQRTESFFALLDLFMPNAKEENRTVEMVSDCLKIDLDGKNLLNYLPQFPVLWLDNELTSRFMLFYKDSDGEIDESSRILLGQCKRASNYEPTNNLELSIIQENYNSFEVLRSNESILYSFGYSQEEVKRIREFDVETIKYGNKPAIERLLLLEGNRGYVPETSAKMDFLKEPLAVCQVLFPILIEDRSAELVYALFNYSPSINKKLSSLMKYYLRALILLDKKKEYWEQIKDNWLTLDLDYDMLLEAYHIAQQIGENELADLLLLYSEKSAFNELETAIINGNVSKLRTITTDADYLVNTGYSTGEIKLIQENARQKVDMTSDDNLAIANRLYTFQKNKNKSAEFYYKLALREGFSLAALGLFSIYAEENRYAELCNLYEKHLDNSTISDASDNKAKYLNALFKTNQFQKMYTLWTAVRNEVALDPLMVLIAALETDESLERVEQELSISSVIIDEDNSGLAIACIKKLAESSSSKAWNLIIDLFNGLIATCDIQELLCIEPYIEKTATLDLCKPKCGGIYAYCHKASDEDIQEWLKYLFDLFTDNDKRIQILKNTVNLSAEENHEVHNILYPFLELLSTQKVEIPELLREYLYPTFETQSNVESWLDEKAKNPECIDETSFEIVCEVAKKTNEIGRMHNFLCSLSCLPLSYSHKYIQQVFSLLKQYEDENAEHALKNALIQCIHFQMCINVITEEELLQLFSAYLAMQMNEYALMADIALGCSFKLSEKQQSDYLILHQNFTSRGNYSLFNVVVNELAQENISSIDRFCLIWNKYIRISEEDAAALSEIRDYYNQPNKWSADSLESLSKYLICNTASSLYWRLLKLYFVNDQANVRMNIAFHLNIIEGRSNDIILYEASELGFENQTKTMMSSILEKELPRKIEKSIETIDIIVYKYPNWFSSKDTVNLLMHAVKKNAELCKDLHALDSILKTIMTIAFLAHSERDFHVLFKEDLDSNLAVLNSKFVCQLILHDLKDTDMYRDATESLIHTSLAVPYKELLCDIVNASNESLTEDVRSEILRIICDNNGENIDELSLYKYYVHAGVEGNSDFATIVLLKIKEYYPNLDVYDDVIKYQLLSNDPSDNSILQIYDSEFEKLKAISDPVRAEKVILNMIPAEMYLASKGIELNSVISYGLASVSGNAAGKIRKRIELCRALDNSFDPVRYPGFAYTFMKCSFIRNWREIIVYNLEDTSINDIIKSDPTVHFFFEKKTYDVLKSIILTLLDTEAGNEAAVDRAFTIITATGGIKKSKNYLRRLQTMEVEDKSLLRRMFSLRIESKTLRESGIIGSTLLQIPRSIELAYFVGMYETRGLSSLFNSELCYKTLLQMPKDEALNVSNIYSTFLYKGFDTCFSKYLSTFSQSQPETGDAEDDPFRKSVDNCAETRNKYQRLKRNAEQSDRESTKNETKMLTISKIEYLYDAVVNHSENDLNQMNPTSMDYISVVTYLFNKKTTTEIREYIWNLNEEGLLPALAAILAILEQYNSSYDTVNKIDSYSWKEASLQLLLRCMQFGKLTKEEKTLRNTVWQQIQPTKEFFIGKFFPVNKDQCDLYINKMYALRSFCKELLEHYKFNGIDISRVSINDERFEAALDPYRTWGEQTNQTSPIQVISDAHEDQETISSIANIDHVASLASMYSTLKVKDNLKLSSANVEDCIGLLKHIIESKHDSTNPQDILRCRDLIRWIYIKLLEKDGFDREGFNHILEFISEKDSIAKAQWDAIFSFLLQYFEKITDVQQLSRVIENDIAYLRNIGKITNQDIKILRSQDIRSWNSIVDVLALLAGIDYLRLSESEQITRLTVCRTKLFSNSEINKSATFDQITACILRLIADKITKLRHNPEIAINIISEDENNQQVIQWENGNSKGTLYSIISNVGGADCQQVTLISTINMTKSRKCFIQTIYAGEKIPFIQRFTSADLIDGIVTWSIDITYYDSEKEKQITLSHETKASIEIGGDSLNLGNIITGNPARGKNFVGRKRELTVLHNRYSELDQLPSMLVRGLKRSGKSSIIIQFADEIKKKNRIIVALVDGQSIGNDIRKAFVDRVFESIRANYGNNNEYKEIFNNSFDDFRQEWSFKLSESEWIGHLDSFYRELSALFNRKILIIIDEMESIFYNHRFESIDQEESLYAALRALIQKPENYVSFIFCGSDALLTSCLEQRRESQMFQTLQYVEVGHMSFNDIQEIFRLQSEKYDIEFTYDAVLTIWQFTNGLVWYAKLLGYLVINNILENDMTIRQQVNRSDIVTAVQMLINGEIGTDKYDLVDASLNTPRTAIVHAMASIMPDYNKELSVDEIATALEMMKMEGYINPRNGENIPIMDEKEIKKQLDFLEKMNFVDSNASKTRYLFTAELYRLFFRNDKKLHLFEERSI